MQARLTQALAAYPNPVLVGALQGRMADLLEAVAAAPVDGALRSSLCPSGWSRFTKYGHVDKKEYTEVGARMLGASAKLEMAGRFQRYFE